MRLMTILLALVMAGCTLTIGFDPTPAAPPAGGEEGVVTQVIDGDTIDVRLSSGVVRVRYIGVNTPERDEPCYGDALRANAGLVEGQQVRLVKDVSDTDRFGRSLRYVYVGSTFVNRELVAQGWAEVVRYSPDTAYFETFRALEQEAARGGRGCHPTGIFNDGTYER